MAENDERINQLIDKLETLLKKQESFSKEVNELREDIYRLKTLAIKQPVLKETIKEEIKENKLVTDSLIDTKKDIAISDIKTPAKPANYSDGKVSEPEKIRMDTEKFIGENLISKIGIAITVIGVAIGAKYAIDHQLISPLTRIILGYLVGLGLLFFSIRLKKNYENFSAVLFSGAMAIMYFITYAAFSFYQLIPQVISFCLMVVVTMFTVTASIKFNKQVIAHIGLVGAYAVPFLLSEGSENALILLSYTAIINIGILIISFKKYWKSLYYSSFFLSWIIYLTWLGLKYQTMEHFGSGLTFLSIFFVTFYIMFLAYKLIQKEKFDFYDIFLLLTNSFIFYGVGYYILSIHDTGKHLLGLFTAVNAIVHLIVSLVIYRQKLADRNLFYLISGLVMVFITLAIPVQLNGNWVTLLWTGEAALLFWIGRTKTVPFYEYLSYVLMFLAFFSILQDWATVYNTYDAAKPETRIMSILNINFLSSLIYISSFALINILNINRAYQSPILNWVELKRLVSFSITGCFLIILYCSFKMEIATYWNQLFTDSLIRADRNLNPVKYWNNDLLNFKSIWILNYSMLFSSVLSLVNIKKLRNYNLGLISLSISIIVMVVFLIQGLYDFSELRETFLNQTLSEYYHRGIFNIGIRYISFAFVGFLLMTISMHINQDYLKQFVFYDLKIVFDILLYISLIWILSSEMISWMDISHSTQSYKLALSILWGSYALFLIGLGIWKKKKHLRIGAIALFAITLIKLFFYDLSHLDTISKTIVFVTLGILLLIISFLYNKYKHIISEDIENFT
jgi:hypothetical protein